MITADISVYKVIKYNTNLKKFGLLNAHINHLIKYRSNI